MNIYVPKDLLKEMDGCDINWSKVACAAFRAEIKQYEQTSNRPCMVACGGMVFGPFDNGRSAAAWCKERLRGHWKLVPVEPWPRPVLKIKEVG